MAAIAGARAHGPAKLSPGSVSPEEKPFVLGGAGEAIRAAKEPGAVETLFLLGVKSRIKFCFISSLLL